MNEITIDSKDKSKANPTDTVFTEELLSVTTEFLHVTGRE